MQSRVSKWIVIACILYFLFLSSAISRLPKGRIKTAQLSVGSFDLRIIILVLNRPKSLLRLLNNVSLADYGNDSVKLEVRIDRTKTNSVDLATVKAARNFVFNSGVYEVIVNHHHMGILGQWLTAWVPRSSSKEIAVILEDDMTLSKHFYRYLKLVHRKYDNITEVNGYALQGQSTTHNLTRRGSLKGPSGSFVFLYPVLGTWGFSPNNKNWRAFLDWYNFQREKTNTKLYIPGNIASIWYRKLSKHGRGHTMWEIWHIYYAWKNHEYTLYSNFQGHNGLSTNWAEKGLHSRGKGKQSNSILAEWEQKFEELPDEPPKLDLSANVISE